LSSVKGPTARQRPEIDLIPPRVAIFQWASRALKRKFGLSFGSLIDVGAYRGDFMRAFRLVSGSGAIVAFEPIPTFYDSLSRSFAGDNCKLYPFALSNSEEQRSMFVAGDAPFYSMFGSLAEPEVRLEEIAGENVQKINTIKVETKRLDSLIDLSELPSPILLKLNTNETELDILKGAGDYLRQIACVRVVYSFTKYYQNAWDLTDLLGIMREHGFGSFFQGLTTNAPGTVLWCGLFFLNDALEVNG
jgi:FkbM family methyltransferase